MAWTFRQWIKVIPGAYLNLSKNDYQIPVVRYGEIRLWTNMGLNEEHEFSNYEIKEFERVFKE